MSENWLSALNADPTPWLLEDDNPAVKHLALRRILDQPAADPEAQANLKAAMQANPIAAILEAQHPDGYWVKPGPGYAPKYVGTVWQVIFLDQLGADGGHPRVRAACDYILRHTQAESGGFAASGSHIDAPPPPSGAIHCVHGNLLHALIGFGWLPDQRVQKAVDWQARAITGEGFERYYQSGMTGPGFCCAANEKLPCAWGAVKSVLALARVPVEQRSPIVQRALQQGVDLLLSCDPTTAAYPAGWGNAKPSSSWFKLGFPLGYVADVLQVLEALCAAGLAKDPRLQPAVRWLLAQQDEQGRWRNRYAYNRKTWVDFEKQGKPGKWVTLRACRVLKAVLD